MKEKDLPTIWQRPVYLPYLQPELTEETIREAEDIIGYKLPQAYTDLLKIQNGGYIRYTINEIAHNVIAGIGPYYPNIADVELLLEYEGSVSYEVKGLFPFDGDGHWHICLDYRQNKEEPEITYIDTESDEERKIANSFKEYLEQLVVMEADAEYVIETTDTLEQMAGRISKITGVDFGEPNSFSHGHPVYSGDFAESYVLLSANKVPYGFVRENEDRYVELYHLMRGSVVRYPEVPESYLFISFLEDKDKQLFFDKLKEDGIVVKELSSFLS